MGTNLHKIGISYSVVSKISDFSIDGNASWNLRGTYINQKNLKKARTFGIDKRNALFLKPRKQGHSLKLLYD